MASQPYSQNYIPLQPLGGPQQHPIQQQGARQQPPIQPDAKNHRKSSCSCWPFRRKNHHHAPKKTLPWPFRHVGINVHIALQVAIMSTIAGLWADSRRNYGIASVLPTPTSPFEGGSSGVLLWTYSLLWTALPAFLMARYTEVFASTLTALKSVQIILEMCRPSPQLRETVCTKCNQVHQWRWKWVPLPLVLKYRHLAKLPRRPKANPGETILLDYDSIAYSIPIWNSWRSYKNHHYLLSLCMFVKFLLTLTGGLAAAILAVANVGLESTVPLRRPADLDGWALSLSSTSASLRPATDVVSATVNNGADLIPWTTATHAFRPFYYDTQGNSDRSRYNLTGFTSGYSATLDCKLLDPVALSAANGITMKGKVGQDGQVTVTFTDRGCNVRKFVDVLDVAKNYFKTWSETTCEGDSGRYRYGFIAGVSSTTSPIGLDNFTIASCVPTFWNSSTLVTVTGPSNAVNLKKGNSVSAMTLVSSEKFELDAARSFIENMPLYAVADPDEQLHMDTLGRLTYDNAVQSNPNSPLNPGTVIPSFEVIFGAVFVAMSALFAFHDDTSTSGDLGGILSTPQNRLFVVWQPALAVLIIMAIALLVVLYIAFVWVPKSKETLLENQELVDGVLLGYAMVASQSEDLRRYIDVVRQEALEEEVARRGGAPPTGASPAAGWWKTAGEDSEEKVLEEVDLVEFARKRRELNEQWECALEGGKIRLRRRPSR
ncbi:hypothetical protein V8F20_006585 [Naviculisporaceae sp. PSN 640]